ncbi:hypothetical protein JJL45_08260 [Tamlana sp. s12]|uniref:hypothetical protein n=1 Tax=Tamlana sp. s12 TaxID=1630406 RepID=UPI0007FD1422|nr:hypothetical protein [Tamlana sp. s12]OBQ55386.1 hypothetical protein VQ01_07885 [Tamlana sp. s12]QQY80934.1 hypothetical protein JJL45_08260 [Tamlana sp. s12]
MDKFLKYMLLIVFISIVSLYLLDTLYTNVYSNAVPRNKTQFILSLDEGETIDYVFLGSSRVENFIMSSEIERITGKRVLNLGSQGARLDDLNIFLRLLVFKKVKIKRMFVQVDYIYNFDWNSEIVRTQVLPFIKGNSVIQDYFHKVDKDFNINYYIPFYRYATSDFRLGFRELVASAVGKQPKINFYDGFSPLSGQMNADDTNGFDLPKTILESNRNIEEMVAICKDSGVELTFFCAPFCSNLNSNNYLEKLKMKLPNFTDLSRVLTKPSMFKNCGHVNGKGAKVFTDTIISRFNL